MIGSAIQKGSSVYVFNEKGVQIWSRPSDALIGFTSSSVTVRVGNNARIYDEKGVHKYTKSL
ncbi:conserved hypothetical protein [Fibrobacter succinogenes subsp. succinogenes S85]|uniref:Lipoprotein n=1 Tax=Fibrobacter succinogenes (strain ATCC 19169 / S85) TaxID=59374 RepID=A0ABM5LIL3_FIBSS|nr:conserved hypothetical protein [Fibrobacter succinogenes subsp. succinogenes S85]